MRNLRAETGAKKKKPNKINNMNDQQLAFIRAYEESMKASWEFMNEKFMAEHLRSSFITKHQIILNAHGHLGTIKYE